MKNLTPEYLNDIFRKMPLELKPTQNRLSIPILNRIYKKMTNGIKFDEIKISDNVIIDGHHRYVSSIIANVSVGYINSLKTSATKVYNWSDVEFLNEEWDTDYRIRMLNEFDAEFNNLSLDKVIEITK